MQNLVVLVVVVPVASVMLAACTASRVAHVSEHEAQHTPAPKRSSSMDLGNFSVSLAVKDLPASRAFYETLGFTAIGGEPAQNWLILQNGHATIGLFQGMFEKNIMTFNPGWDRSGENADEFTDVRELQRRIKAAGVTLVQEADEATTGPASFVLHDPDGNMILFDQHR